MDSVSLDELFLLAGEDKQAFLERFCARRLTYGDIVGSEALREGVCGLYKSLKPDEVIPTHGAAGANYHVFCSLISRRRRGEHHAGLPAALLHPRGHRRGRVAHAPAAGKRIPSLTLPSWKSLVDENTKLIQVNNPNNPTGALMSRSCGENH